MANSANVLTLLADDIKLSLLERQRSVSLGIESDAQNGNISRSLESMRDGVEGLEADAHRLEGKGDGSASTISTDAQRLRNRYEELTAQFHGHQPMSSGSSGAPPAPRATANDGSGQQSTDARTTTAQRRSQPGGGAAPAAKNVRFRDASPDAEEEATRAALFPYKDDPSALEAQTPDRAGLSNSQMHAYHDQVMAEQDEQLDQLGESIGRQRELGMRIGDELDEHVAMLDDVDRHVDRQQGRLQGARDRIGRIARRANDNRQLTTIVVLIVILVLLIIVLK